MKKLNILICFLVVTTACKKEDNPPAVTTDPEEISSIVINEFLASNTACCSDPAGAEEFDDWIEIYNTGDKAVNIGGWYISDKADIPQKFQIPASAPAETTIEAGGYIVLWADKQPEQGVLHLDFALNADGEYIGIYTPEGKVADETTFGLQTPDVSTGRLPNGSGDWSSIETPSPGAAN